MKTKRDIELLLRPLPHKTKVRFAYDCCLSIKDLMSKEGLKVMDLLDLWLKDSSKVSDDELRSAAYAATHATPYATHAASYADHTALTAIHAAYTAIHTANDASHAASYTAYSAAYAADKNISLYYDMLVGMFKDLTEVEKEMLDLGDL